MKPNFWRPQTDNDRKRTDKVMKHWMNMGSKLVTDSVVLEKPNKVIVKRSAEKTALTITYTVGGDGSIEVATELDADPSLPRMPRLGFTLGVSGGFEKTQYYGKGPWENYCDRNAGAEVGLYESPTAEMFYEYAKPQENGLRTETRWLELSGSAGKLRVDGTFSFSIWPWSTETLTAAGHPYDLKDQGFFTLNIDHRHMGVGGQDSWTLNALPLEHYRVPAGRYSWSFVLTPLD